MSALAARLRAFLADRTPAARLDRLKQDIEHAGASEVFREDLEYCTKVFRNTGTGPADVLCRAISDTRAKLKDWQAFHATDRANPPSSAGQQLANLRHKDNHADRDFIRQWYQKNRALYPSKDAAATAAKEQRLVDQEWRTIRGYLTNI